MPVEPFVDHGTSQRFRLRTIAVYDFSRHFNVARMNGYDPLISFDPSADGVSNALVFHGPQLPLPVCLNLFLALADRRQSRETLWHRERAFAVGICYSARRWRVARSFLRKPDARAAASSTAGADNQSLDLKVGRGFFSVIALDLIFDGL
jgi:hypothetical protein